MIDYFENQEREARQARLEDECERNAAHGADIPWRHRSKENYFISCADQFIKKVNHETDKRPGRDTEEDGRDTATIDEAGCPGPDS